VLFRSRLEPRAAGVRGGARRRCRSAAWMRRGRGRRNRRRRAASSSGGSGRRRRCRANPRPGHGAHRDPSPRGPPPRSGDPAAHLERKAAPGRSAASAAVRRAEASRPGHLAARREGDRALAAREAAVVMTDVVVAGGGPAGLAAAIRSAERGLRTVLLERSASVPDKACGEGLMPGGARELERLGATIPLGHSASLRGIRYLQEDGTVLEGQFGGRPGMGIRRTVLAQALRERASAAGADLRRGTVLDMRPRADAVEVKTDSGDLEARLLIADRKRVV